MRGLSRQQLRLAECLARGRGAKDAAGELGLSLNTVKDYAKTVHRRLGVHGSRELQAAVIERLLPDGAQSLQSVLQSLAVEAPRTGPAARAAAAAAESNWRRR